MRHIGARRIGAQTAMVIMVLMLARLGRADMAPPQVFIDPPEPCIGPGTLLTVTVMFTGTAGDAASLTVTPSEGLVVVGGCTASSGTCTVQGAGVTWSGTLPMSGMIEIRFGALIDAHFPAGTQLCFNAVVVDNGQTQSVQACFPTTAANCGAAAPALGHRQLALTLLLLAIAGVWLARRPA